MAEFAMEQALRLYSSDVISKVDRSKQARTPAEGEEERTAIDYCTYSSVCQGRVFWR